MELRHLRYFSAVAEEASITKAAARLYMTQPALSRQLRDLERHVGTELLVRSAGGVRLTEAGERLRIQAEPILAQADLLAARVRSSGTEASGVLRIGLLDEGAAELTEPLLAAFKVAEPQVGLAVRNVAWGPHAELLAAGRLDAVIGPSPAGQDRFSSVPLFADGRLAILSTRDPLADNDVVMTQDLLRLAPLRPTGIPQAALHHFLMLDLRDDGPTADDSAPFVMADGLADIARDRSYLTVTTATERFFKHPGVVFRPVPDAVPTFTSVITLPSNSLEERGGVIESFVSTAAAVARELACLVPGAVSPPGGAAPPSPEGVVGDVVP
jgi:DNA-binding transcriptional LysR family regulator